MAKQLHGFKIKIDGSNRHGASLGVGVQGGREKEIEGQTRFPLDALATENVPLLSK